MAVVGGIDFAVVDTVLADDYDCYLIERDDGNCNCCCYSCCADRFVLFAGLALFGNDNYDNDNGVAVVVCYCVVDAAAGNAKEDGDRMPFGQQGLGLLMRRMIA